LVHAFADQLDGMVPCDVSAFIVAYEHIRGDLALIVLAARIKEPRCIGLLVESFRRHGPGDYTAADLRAWLHAMVKDVAARPPPHHSELKQLSILGAGRLNGSQVVAQDLKIVRKACKDEPGAFPLGMSTEFFVATEATVDLIGGFLDQCRQQVIPWDQDACSLKVWSSALSRAITSVAGTIGGDMGKPGSYNHCTVLRKAVLGEIAFSPRRRPDWSEVTIAELRGWCPDVCDNLDFFDADLAAGTASAVILGRPDHAMFLSMWACLWGQIAPWFDLTDLQVVFAGTGLSAIVTSYTSTYGVPPHPYNAAAVYMQPKKQQTPEAKEKAKAKATKSSSSRPKSSPSSSSRPKSGPKSSPMPKPSPGPSKKLRRR